MLLFIIGVVFAEPVYFKFYPEKNLLLIENVQTLLKINYDIIGGNVSRFKTRPVISNGALSLYKKETDEWIAGNDMWSSLPRLDKEITVKASSLSEPQVDLYFIIQDTITSKIYETPKVRFWTDEVYKDYLRKLNEHISSHGYSGKMNQ